MTTLQKIKDIEDEMAKTQKNKATSGHLGGLKAKLAKLKREVMSHIVAFRHDHTLIPTVHSSSVMPRGAKLGVGVAMGSM